MDKNKKALVLLSGGQDSVTSLFWALENFGNVAALTVKYGQKHATEVLCAKKIAKKIGIEHNVVDMSFLKNLSPNSLTTSDSCVEISNKKGLPDTFVPGRNMLFITTACAWGYARGFVDIVIGVSQVDYSGYPDCRANFISACEKTVSLALDTTVKIHAPLIFMSKKDTVLLMQSFGKIDYLKYTHTCYNGKRPPCGVCAACVLRREGFNLAGMEDPLEKKGTK